MGCCIAVRAYKRTSSEQKIQVSKILYGVNATKSKKVKEQERCETLDKNCAEIKKNVNQSSPQRISGDKSTNINISLNVN